VTTAQPRKFTFTTATGAVLAGYHWPAAAGQEPRSDSATAEAGPAPGGGRAPLIMIHGFGEHARRHGALAQAAAAAGHDVFGFDQEGHGESPGPRAVVAGFTSARAAVAALSDRAARQEGVGSGRAPPRPVLFGHSMGGLVALDYALDRPDDLAALMLSAPALRDAVERPAWLVKLASTIARLAPTLPVVQLDVKSISRDPAEVRRYADDPLIHHRGVPAVTGYTINSRGAELLSRAGALRVPTLAVHGEADKIMAVEGSRLLAAGAPRGMVELHTFPAAFHELHHDPPASGVRERVLDVERAFLAAYG